MYEGKYHVWCTYGTAWRGCKIRVAAHAEDSTFRSETVDSCSIQVPAMSYWRGGHDALVCGSAEQMTIACCMCEPTETAQSLGDDTHAAAAAARQTGA